MNTMFMCFSCVYEFVNNVFMVCLWSFPFVDYRHGVVLASQLVWGYYKKPKLWAWCPQCKSYANMVTFNGRETYAWR